MKLPGLSTLHRHVATYGVYAGALMVRGTELVGKLGLYMLAARILGAHEAGLFFLCITWVGLAATAARAGFEKATVRHIASEIALGRLDTARAAMRTGALWVFLGGVVATFLTLIIATPAATLIFADPSLAPPLLIAAVAILPQALCFFVAHALFGLDRGVAGQFVQNASWPIFTLGAMLAGVRSLDGILYALAAANLASMLIGVVFLVRARPDRIAVRKGPKSASTLPELWRTALPLGVVEVVQVSLTAIPIMLLAAVAAPSVVGAFSVANRLSQLIWVVIIAIGSIAAPRFAALHRLQDWAGLRAQNRRARLLVALAGLPPIALMMLFPATILGLIGPGYEIAATALAIMCLGQLVNCLLPCQDIMLAMTGQGSVLRWLNFAQLGTCIVAGALLVPAFGMTGAAVLSALVIAQGAVGTTLMVRCRLPQAL
ncbi:lipopolysaccharide biosynthesis protein [Ancylobacter pratisalsi]|uniref:Oligosaccharide flippase family protein n=1 Tax=Ancylobacter pratisalsi TaxID=1745854 RepID=A0A6P1YUZ6_9HYPH|nr:oligosaccharide flippase family protein [Ancylobacter pratisalsi]QIB35434.1 oligosaccharide flippase family protein [Ancylobacter pratisalsi]